MSKQNVPIGSFDLRKVVIDGADQKVVTFSHADQLSQVSSFSDVGVEYMDFLHVVSKLVLALPKRIDISGTLALHQSEVDVLVEFKRRLAYLQRMKSRIRKDLQEKHRGIKEHELQSVYKRENPELTSVHASYRELYGQLGRVIPVKKYLAPFLKSAFPLDR